MAERRVSPLSPTLRPSGITELHGGDEGDGYVLRQKSMSSGNLLSHAGAEPRSPESEQDEVQQTITVGAAENPTLASLQLGRGRRSTANESMKSTPSMATGSMSSLPQRVNSLDMVVSQQSTSVTLLVVGALSAQHHERGVRRTADAILSYMNELADGKVDHMWLNADVLVNDDPSKWPSCAVLWTLWSADLPMTKVKAYVERVKPIEINNVEELINLRDRRWLLKKLRQFGVPVPEFVIVSREPGQEEPVIIEQEDHIIVNDVRLDKPFVEKPADSMDHEIFIYYPSNAGGGRARLGYKGWTDAVFDQGKARVRRNGSFVYEKFVPSEGFSMRLFCVGSEYVHAEATHQMMRSALDGLTTPSGPKSPTLGRQCSKEPGLPERWQNPYQSGSTPVAMTAGEKLLARRAALAIRQVTFNISVLRTQSGATRSFVHGIHVTHGGLPKVVDMQWDPCKDALVQDMSKCLLMEINDQLDAHRRGMRRVVADNPGGIQSLTPKSMRVPVKLHLGRRGNSMHMPFTLREEDSRGSVQLFGDLPESGSESPLGFIDEESPSVNSQGGFRSTPAVGSKSPNSAPQLLAILGVFRHGDRTPKQKVKFSLKCRADPDCASLSPTNRSVGEKKEKKTGGCDDFYLGVVMGWIIGDDENVEGIVAEPPHVYNLRASNQMSRLYSVLQEAYRAARGDPSNCKLEPRTAQDLTMIASAKTVIDAALKQAETTNLHAKIDIESGLFKVSLKWGGDLTKHGEDQAIALGDHFKNEIYPFEDMHRLHASLRHDLKIHSSSEPRCAQTAAAFAQGLLSMQHVARAGVQVNFVRLDDLGRLDKTPFMRSKDTQAAKEKTVQLHTSGRPVDEAYVGDALIDPSRYAYSAAHLYCCRDQGKTVRDALVDLAAEIQGLTAAFAQILESSASEPQAPRTKKLLTGGLPLCRQRWSDLAKDSISGEPKMVSPINVVAILDMAKYDRRHKTQLFTEAGDCDEVIQRLSSIYELATRIGSYSELGEYGTTASQKMEIAGHFLRPMLRKIRWDLRIATGMSLGEEEQFRVHQGDLYKPAQGRDSRSTRDARSNSGELHALREHPLRSRLYFAHHSHMQSMVNLLLWADEEYKFVSEKGEEFLSSMRMPLGYLCHLVFKLFRRADKRLMVSVELSPGDEGGSECSRVPASQMLHEAIPHEILDAYLSRLIGDADGEVSGIPSGFPSGRDLVLTMDESQTTRAKTRATSDTNASANGSCVSATDTSHG